MAIRFANADNPCRPMPDTVLYLRGIGIPVSYQGFTGRYKGYGNRRY